MAVSRDQKLFIVKFFGILVPAYLLIAWSVVNDRAIVPLTAAIARVAGVLLDLIGQDVTVRGTVISSPHFAVNINNGCNGVEAMLILLACIFAFRAPLKARLLGLLAGAVLVQVLNELRIVSLFLIGRYRPSLFELFHLTVWQVVIIAATIGFFVAWSVRVAPQRLASRA